MDYSQTATGRDESPSSLKLLSFDGGGIRGLSSLIILKHLMERIQPGKPPRPCDYFDMIAGTSTGGLIAIMLGRFQMNVDECIEKYLNLSSTAFKLKRSRLDLIGRAKTVWKGEGAYQGDTLASEFKKAAFIHDGDEDAKLAWDNHACRVFVCSFGKSLNRPVRFRSYDTPSKDDAHPDCTIWEAARATSAAATFFDPMIIGNQSYVDGATGMNNPVFALLQEAEAVWPDALSRIQCIVSIGTGVPEPRDFGDDIKSILHTLKAIATETEETHLRFLKIYERRELKGRYFRFNVPNGLAGVKLDDHTKIPTIESAAETYMNSHQAQAEATKFVAASPRNQDHILTNHPEQYFGWLPCIDQQQFFHEAKLRRKLDKSGDWFLQEHFPPWQQDQKSLLWLHGNAGTGKTVLTSGIIDKITDESFNAVAYYYFSFQFKEGQNLQQFKYALLTQLVRKLSRKDPQNEDSLRIPKSFHNLWRNNFPSRNPPMEDVDATMIDMVNKARKTSIVIDALDECEDQSFRAEVLKYLCWIASRVDSKAQIHILVTSRPNVDVQMHIDESSIKMTSVPLDAGRVTEDISDHLQAVTEEGPYNRWSADQKRQVISHITSHAAGNFRWADLQIQALHGKSREIDVSRTLKKLPRDLTETYERMLEHVCAHGFQHEALAVLRWMCVQQRGMKLVEIAEVTAFETPEDAELSPDSEDYCIEFKTQNRFDGVGQIVRILEGLITVSGSNANAKKFGLSTDLPGELGVKDLFVEFSHFSVFEYLSSDLVKPSLFRLRADESNWFCAKSCLAYLDYYDTISSSLFQPDNLPLLSYACFRLRGHIQDLSSQEPSKAANLNALLESQKSKTGYSLSLALRSTRQNRTISRNVDNFVENFASYDDGESIVKAFRLGDPNLLRLLLSSGINAPKDLLTRIATIPKNSQVELSCDKEEEEEAIPSSRGAVYDKTTDAWSSTTAARSATSSPTSSNDTIMLQMLIDHTDVDVNATNDHDQDPLSLAALWGKEEIFSFFKAQPQADYKHRDNHGWDVLMCAIIGANRDIIQSVANALDCDLIKTDKYGWTALDWAKYKGVDDVLPTASETVVHHPEGSLLGQSAFELAGEVTASDAISSEVWAVQFSHDGERIAACLSTEKASIFSTSTLTHMLDLGAHSGGVVDAAWSFDDSMIVTCCQDRYARLWDTKTGNLLWKTERFLEPVSGCIWLPNKNTFFVSSLDSTRPLSHVSLEISGETKVATVSQFDTSYSLPEPEETTSDSGASGRSFPDVSVRGIAIAPAVSVRGIEGMDMSSDGDSIVAFNPKNVLLMYNTKVGKVKWAKAVESRVTSVCFAQDANRILLNLQDGTFELRDSIRGNLSATFKGISSSEFLLRSSFGGVGDAFIIKPEEDGCITVWSTDGARLIGHALGHHPIRANVVSWRPGHPYSFASGGDDGKVKL